MAQTLLGFDFGRLRIGVAQGNTVTCTAQALTIVAAQPPERCWREIMALVAEWAPALLVVGRPVPDERVSNIPATARRCEDFARELAQRTGLPVELLDESGSTLEAQSLLRARQTGGRGASRRDPAGAAARGVVPAAFRRTAATQGDDAEAAAVILRQYLSGPRSGEPAHPVSPRDCPSDPLPPSMTG